MVWCGTQRPFGVRSEVAQAFHLAEDKVRVIVPDMGSAYGGKHTGEHAIEAARLAKAAGRPVKIVYSRPEEFHVRATCVPSASLTFGAAVDARGRLVAWEFDNYNSGTAGLQHAVRRAEPARRVSRADSPFRQGSYRGLAATANNYVREMHMDALARAAGADAVAFRLAHIDEPAPARGALDRRRAVRLARIRRQPAARSASRAASRRAATSRRPPSCPARRTASSSNGWSSSSSAARSSIRTACGTRPKALSFKVSAVRCSRRSLSPTARSSTRRSGSTACRDSRTSPRSTIDAPRSPRPAVGRRRRDADRLRGAGDWHGGSRVRHR